MKLKFGVLNELLDHGEVYMKKLGDLKAETIRASARNAMAGAKRKRKAEDTLKVKNPWSALAGRDLYRDTPVRDGVAMDPAVAGVAALACVSGG